MKTIKDYISEAERLINEYKALDAKCEAFYDENISGKDFNVEVNASLSMWAKMNDEAIDASRKAIKAVKNCYRLFGIQLPKEIGAFNMGDYFCKFQWLVEDIDKDIRQYRFQDKLY